MESLELRVNILGTNHGLSTPETCSLFFFFDSRLGSEVFHGAHSFDLDLTGLGVVLCSQLANVSDVFLELLLLVKLVVNVCKRDDVVVLYAENLVAQRLERDFVVSVLCEVEWLGSCDHIAKVFDAGRV